MKLYLIQHGEAKSETEDPERSLTKRGEEEVRNVAMAAKKLNLHTSKIFHSGKLRARQTAEIFGNAFNQNPEAVHGLNPNDEVQPWADRIFQERENLMIVGHLPFLEKLASLLISGDEKARSILFRYGAIVCLEQKGDKGWAVRWILTPEMVSALS